MVGGKALLRITRRSLEVLLLNRGRRHMPFTGKSSLLGTDRVIDSVRST
jgi:hypothetical protein